MILIPFIIFVIGFFFPPAWLALVGYAIYAFASRKSRRDDAVESRIKKMVSAGIENAVFSDLYFDAARSYAIEKGAQSPEQNAASATIIVNGRSYFVVFMRDSDGGTTISVRDDRAVEREVERDLQERLETHGTKRIIADVDSLKIRNLNHKTNEAPILLNQMGEDKIEMDIVRFIRVGGPIGHIPDTDYEKLKSYAISKGGIIGYNDSVSVRLIILDKLYRLKFDKIKNNSVGIHAQIIDKPLNSTHGIHVISYGKNYKLDMESFRTYYSLSNESGVNKDGKENKESCLTPEDFVSANYDMKKFFLTSTLKYRAARPEWAYYDDELKTFQRGILVKSLSLEVDEYFSTRFLDDEVGLNYMMAYIHSAEAKGYDIEFLTEVGVYVIKKIWEQPNERAKFLEKWSLSEKSLPAGSGLKIHSS